MDANAFPLPRIGDSLDALSGNKYFGKLELGSGYWQVPLDEDAQEKAVFVIRGRLWKWKVLPFRLTSAPATFQRLMERVPHGLHWKTLLLYLDDIIVKGDASSGDASPSAGGSLQSSMGAGLKFKPSKCTLLQRKVRCLGHIVSGEGVATDLEKLAAVRNWPIPRNVRGVKAFLGMVGYYHHFVQDLAQLARPLTGLTDKNVPWKWDSET